MKPKKSSSDASKASDAYKKEDAGSFIALGKNDVHATPQLLLLLPTEFHDYACAKAFDILSKGLYKKFLLQSRNAGEEWACNVVESVVKVQGLVLTIHELINEMPSWKKKEGRASKVCMSSLADACIEVMECATPPKRRRHVHGTCSITGASLSLEEGF